MSLREAIERLMEKLYAGFNVYAALSLQIWVVIFSLYLFVTPTIVYQAVFTSVYANLAYWIAAVILTSMFGAHMWRKYLARLAAASGVRRRSWVERVVWPAAFISSGFLVPMYSRLLGTFEAAIPYSIQVAILVGVVYEAIVEARLSSGKPGPMVVVASILGFSTFLYPLLVLREVWAYWLYMMSSVLLSYSTGALLYMYNTLRRIT